MDVVRVQPNAIGDVVREAAVRKPLCHTPKGERVPPRPTEEADIKHTDWGGDPHRHLTWDEAQWWLRTESIPWRLMAMDIGVTKF